MKISELQQFITKCEQLGDKHPNPEIPKLVNHLIPLIAFRLQEAINKLFDAGFVLPNQVDLDSQDVLSKAQENAPLQNDLSAIRQYLTELNDQISNVLAQQNPTDPAEATVTQPTLSPEKINALRQKLSAEYDQHLEFLHFLELLPKEGPQEFTSVVTGKTYQLPEKQEVTNQWFTPEKLVLISEMEEQGLKPELKIFPLLTLKELKAKINAQKAELKGPGVSKFDGLYILGEIKEAELKYSPSQVKAGPEGKTLTIEGGMSQAEWIDQNQGYIIEVVPTVKETTARDDLQKAQNGEWLYNGQQAANLWQDAKSKGLSSLSYVESAILGAEAVKRGEPLDQENYTVLLESNLTDCSYISAGGLGANTVDLSRNYAGNRGSSLRCRFSVRGKRPTETPSTHPSNSKTTDLSPEVKEIAEALEKDYQQVIKAFRHFGFRTTDPLDQTKEIFTPLIQEDPEKPGIYYYEADYDGRAEMIIDPVDSAKMIPNPEAKNFTGDRFNMPTLEECLKSLTPEQVKLYQEMSKAGKEPKLRLTPLGYKTETLASAIDSRMKGTGPGKIVILSFETYVNEDILDHKLIYEPEDLEAVNEDLEVKITGGKALSQLITENQGWKIELIENVQELETDTDKTTDTKKTKDGETEEYTLAKKQELYFRGAKSKGQTGLSYKSILAAQMCNLIEKTPKPFDQKSLNILTESCLTDSESVPEANWFDDQVSLDWTESYNRGDSHRFRRSVNVKRLKT